MVYKNCTVRVASWGLVDSPLMTAECAALVTAGGSSRRAGQYTHTIQYNTIQYTHTHTHTIEIKQPTNAHTGGHWLREESHQAAQTQHVCVQYVTNRAGFKSLSVLFSSTETSSNTKAFHASRRLFTQHTERERGGGGSGGYRAHAKHTDQPVPYRVQMGFMVPRCPLFHVMWAAAAAHCSFSVVVPLSVWGGGGGSVFWVCPQWLLRSVECVIVQLQGIMVVGHARPAQGTCPYTAHRGAGPQTTGIHAPTCTPSLCMCAHTQTQAQGGGKHAQDLWSEEPQSKPKSIWSSPTKQW